MKLYEGFNKPTHTEDYLPTATLFAFFLGLGIVLAFIYSL